MATSKQLNSADTSGEILSQYLFSNPAYKDLIIDFDRIHYDFQQQRYTIIEHILIEEDEKPKSFNHLDDKQKSKIINLMDFKQFIKEKSGLEINLYVDFYFPKESKNCCDILFFPENQIDFDKEFIETNLEQYAYWFQIENFYGEEKNKNLTYTPKKISSQLLNKKRDDNSAFALSKSCLNEQVTYGFNLDKIIFNKKEKSAFVLEFLLCEENQNVSPHTSHPNRYFNKNASKFINLNKFTQEVLKSKLYLINYAKPGTKHGNKIKWMRVDDINPADKAKPVLTKDLNTTPIDLKLKLENKLLTQLTVKQNLK